MATPLAKRAKTEPKLEFPDNKCFWSAGYTCHCSAECCPAPTSRKTFAESDIPVAFPGNQSLMLGGEVCLGVRLPKWRMKADEDWATDFVSTMTGEPCTSLSNLPGRIFICACHLESDMLEPDYDRRHIEYYLGENVLPLAPSQKAEFLPETERFRNLAKFDSCVFGLVYNSWLKFCLFFTQRRLCSPRRIQPAAGLIVFLKKFLCV